MRILIQTRPGPSDAAYVWLVEPDKGIPVTGMASTLAKASSDALAYAEGKTNTFEELVRQNEGRN